MTHIRIYHYIDKAKKKVEKDYNGSSPSSRTWEVARANDVEIHVYAGSPDKGYVVVNHGAQTVMAFNVEDKRLCRWTQVDMELMDRKGARTR